MLDQTVNSTDPLTAKDQIPVDLHVLVLDSSKKKMAPTTLLPPRKITESFVLSFDTNDVEQFKERNNHSGLGEVLWVPSVDEFQQKTEGKDRGFTTYSMHPFCLSFFRLPSNLSNLFCRYQYQVESTRGSSFGRFFVANVSETP